MYRFFRFIIVLLALVTSLTSIFAFVGSYKNEKYLTRIYLINFHLTELKLLALLDISKFSKREYENDGLQERSEIMGEMEATGTVEALEKRAVSSQTAEQIEAAISSLVSTVSYDDLGLSQVYSVSFWGYCRGKVNGKSESVAAFDNSDVTFTSCTKPKAGFFFDPLTIFKDELKRNIKDSDLDSTLKSEMETLADNVSYSNLNLPGNLKTALQLLNNLTKAGFALILLTAIFSTVYAVLEFLGMIFAPDSFCFSCCSHAIQVFIFLFALVGSALVTGAYVYTRKEINNNTDDFGVKSFLSIAFYALSWASVVSSLLIIVVSIFGRCCNSCFGGRRYKNVNNGPQMGYYHQEQAPFLERKVSY